MSDRFDDIPADVMAVMAPHLDPPEATLTAITNTLLEKRNDARTARTSSGIEAVWQDAEEAYIGIDDANRGDYGNMRWAKPVSMQGPVTAGKTVNTKQDVRSTAYARLTARYVDAGTAKLCEILLPPDDKAFSITETPLPELIKAKGDKTQVHHSDMGNVPLTRDAQPGEAPDTGPQPGSPMLAQPAQTGAAAPASADAGAAPTPAAGGGGAVPAPPAGAQPAAPQVPLTVADLAKEHIEIARSKAKMAETRIWDWMTESHYNAQMRKVVFDSARLGSGILKGPFPKAKRSVSAKKSDGGKINVTVEDKIFPAAEWTDVWNIFPDPTCGEDIHNGDFMFERDFLSERQVRDLLKLPGYIKSAINEALELGPTDNVSAQQNSADSGAIRGDTVRKGRYEVWYFYGQLTRDELAQISEAGDKPITKDDVAVDQKMVHVIATLIGDKLVRAVINPLDSGAFPYHNMIWQRRAGHWAGIGVAEQIRMPQRTVNAAIRAMLNNAGKSAGSQIVLNHSKIKPSDGNWTITPDKIWFKTGDDLESVEDAFQVHEIQNVTDKMLLIIEFAMKQAEEATSIPLITQGQSGPTTPETYGATQLQDNNANQLLRSIGYTVDDNVTEPFIRAMYEWLLLDPDVPDEEKGDFQINAHGSSALVERAIQDMTLAQMGPLSLQPAYGIDPKRWAEQFIKSKRLNPVDLMFTKEELEQMAKAPPPPSPQEKVAQINASVERDKIIAAQSSDQQNAQHEQQLHEAELALEGKGHENDAAQIQAERERTHVQAVTKLHELQERRELAMLEYANRHRISLDQAKAALAKTAMTLQAQRELNAADNAVDLHKHHNPPPNNDQPGRVQKPQPKKQIAKPLAQLPGRAPNGKAFEQA